jgi:hypothetical protein
MKEEDEMHHIHLTPTPTSIAFHNRIGCIRLRPRHGHPIYTQLRSLELMRAPTPTPAPCTLQAKRACTLNHRVLPEWRVHIGIRVRIASARVIREGRGIRSSSPERRRVHKCWTALAFGSAVDRLSPPPREVDLPLARLDLLLSSFVSAYRS